MWRPALKVIIAGSRDLNIDMQDMEDIVKASSFTITEVVSGGASGVDSRGEKWAEAYKIPLKVFPADWATHGKSAGPIRNRAMAEYADALIAVWDGKSRGTANMVQAAFLRGLKVYVYHYNAPMAEGPSASSRSEQSYPLAPSPHGVTPNE
jgi:hypothetical protein